MVFKKKPKPPLAEAVSFVHQACEIAYKYLRDKKYIPTEMEFKHLDDLVEVLWQNHTTVEYIQRCLHQRQRGEPEGCAKFTNRATFDYHYPG